MLSTYAKPTAIREALDNIRRSMLQRNEQDEALYKKRLNDAIYHCGNFQEEDKMMIIYIDGIIPTSRTIVSRFRECQLRRAKTFEDIR